MEFSELPLRPFLLLLILLLFRPTQSTSNLFREYIGAEFKSVTFSDLPINSDVEFHFIVSFAIDYTNSSSSPSPTNGEFNIFWDKDNLSPSQVSSIKSKHSNVKVAVSIGGDTVGNGYANFSVSSPSSWISNAVSSLTNILQEYNLDGNSHTIDDFIGSPRFKRSCAQFSKVEDACTGCQKGIDIDYEHFETDPQTFAHCIGELISTLKRNRVISFASIAPFNDDQVQNHYTELWRRYGHMIDYVNFQFYSYDKGTTVSQFLEYFDTQSSNYEGGKVLASFISDGSGGLSPQNGFFTACTRLKSEGKLHGIFIWCADDSKALGFRYENQSQALLANSH